MKFYDVIYTIERRTTGRETLVSTFFSEEEVKSFLLHLSWDDRVIGWEVEVY